MVYQNHWRYKLLTLVFAFPVLLFSQTEGGNNSQNDSTENSAARGAFNTMNQMATDTQDKIEKEVADSTRQDSLIEPGMLETMVNYHAEDSMSIVVAENKAYLYNKAHIDYGDVSLDAGYIELDWMKNEVFARGILDSAGEMTQMPVFKQGADIYETDEIRYNFATNKALIKTVVTKEGESFLHGEVIKREDENTFYIKGIAFTTCNKRHPHFHINANKAKVIVGDRIITGPAYLEVADVPTPIVLPFGFFPAQDKRASGFILPTFNQHQGKGFGLVNGGYYFSLSDYLDLKLTGEVYARGGWGVWAVSNYKKRYKYNGNIQVRFNHTKVGDKRFENFATQYIDEKTFKINWQHKQDPKARPDLLFSAKVDLANPNFNRLNTTETSSFLQNTTASSVSLSKNWMGTPFSLSASANHSQNNNTKNFDLSLPKVSFNMSRIFPFKKKNRVGTQKWYERIGTNYSTNTEVRFNGNYDSLSTGAESFDQIIRTGMQHNVNLSTNEKLFRHITLNPSINYATKWYPSKLNYRYDDSSNLIVDTIPGFSLTNELSANAQFSTKVYGTFLYRKGKIKAIRHMMTPSMGVTFRPDYSDPFWGSYQTLIDTAGEEIRFSRYNGYLYGGTSSGNNGSVNFNLNNNIEMKIRSNKDSTGERKVKLLDRLNFGTSYNIAAESFQWQNMNVVAQSSILKNKVQLSYQGKFDFYGYDPQLDKRVNRSAWEINKKLIRNVNTNFSVNMRWAGRIGEERKKKESKSLLGLEEDDINYYRIDDYIDFSMPWQFVIRYNYQISKPGLEANVSTHTIGLQGKIDPTPNWHISIETGYNLVDQGVTYTRLELLRDLHCWELKIQWVPFGFQQSYMIGINIKASSFKDAKLERRRNVGDF